MRSPMTTSIFRLVLASLLTLSAGACVARAAAATELRVVASIKPVHALVAGVMGDEGGATLLVKGRASPHEFALRPSAARALARADVVFWVGPELETFLVKPLATLPAGARAIALLRAPGVTVLPTRQGGIWQDAISEDRQTGDKTWPDGHVWLDPRNARAMVAAIAETLVKADPANAARYRTNAERLGARITALDIEIAASLRAVRAVPYIVFHDAYQYFEARFALNALGAVTVHPDRPAGAKRLQAIRAHIRTTKVACLFREPQFAPRLANTVIEDTETKLATLDPLGAALPPGPGLYFTLMRDMAADLRGCLIGAVQ